MRDPRILAPVTEILGPDVTVMSADIWRKVAGETRHISWHQDASYWSLEPLEIMTAWIALTPATRENGCMRFAPGSHKRRVEHRNTFAADNMLSHGQTVQLEIDEASTVEDVLSPGEMSLHHASWPMPPDPMRPPSLGSVSPSATFPAMSGKWRGRAARRSR